MLISQIKPIGKVGKKLLENEDSNRIIEKIIEKPLQKACKQCKEKNIETVMSSCNKNNLVKKEKNRINKKEVLSKIKNNRIQNFLQAGKGYAWIMINYNTLSEENKEILYEIEEEKGEESIWFVKTDFIELRNKIRRIFKLKEIDEYRNDKYAKKFKEKEVMLRYNNKYPDKNVFIRMPIYQYTEVEDIELYFDRIISKLKKQ